MRNTSRNTSRILTVRLDAGLIIAFLMGCIAAWPFFQHVGLPQANDAELHIYRVAELGYSLQLGNLYPRWAPDFYYGHGYPIFNYYSPLIYHVGNWLTLFHPENAVIGAKLLFILSHVLGAIGAYLLGRKFGGQSGGLLGSAAFTFSPYILLINPHVRGDLAEVFAVSLMPWALWGWEKLWHEGSRTAFIAAISTAACVLLSHNLTGLTLLLLLCALSLSKLFSSDRKNWRWALLAGMLVATLTAYFWLPFLLERSYIKLEVAGDGHYDFREHFVLIRDLLAFIPLFDWRSTAMQAPMSAGPLMLLLACFSIILHLRVGSLRRILFYIVTAGICFWLVTYDSKWAWEAVPGMTFYQFPWRFLGPLAALIIPLVSSVYLPQKKWACVFVPIILMGIMASALPALYPIPWESDMAPITPARYIEAELEGRWRGTTSTNDFVPVYVDMIPGPQPSVVASYEQGPVDRVNRYTLPEGTRVEVIKNDPWNNHFCVQTPQEFVLRLYLFYFPGWKAYVDGVETSIDVAHPEGFITLVVPEGEHNVKVKFEDTPPRKAGWAIALFSGLVFGIAIWRLPKAQLRTTEVDDSEFFVPTNRRVLLVIMVFALFKGIVLDNTGWLHYDSPSETVLVAHYRQQANFGEEISLLGYNLSAKHLKPGQMLDVTLYWNAQRPITQTYQSFVQLVSSEGVVGSQSDHLNPAGFPTNLWPTDRYVGDKHRLTLPVEMMPGDYQLFVGLYRLQDDLRRLPVIDTGETKTDYLILSQTILVE